MCSSNRTLPTRELGEERPGRVYDSVGGRRSSMETPDYHTIAETQFLERAVKQLDELVREHKVKHLLVAAPLRRSASCAISSRQRSVPCCRPKSPKIS